jgi:glycine betaine/proline transport system permease protein
MLALLQTEWIPEIPLDTWVDSFVSYVTDTFAGFFSVVETLIATVVSWFASALSFPPELVMVALFGVVAFVVANWRVALFTVLGLLLIISLGLWEEAMLTLALVVSSAIVALAIGIPIGIIASKSLAAEAITRPILDFMQTMPAFVYLIPGILVLGLGEPPALVATVIFAMPPAVRLTLLGIQQVSKETVEAAQAFGATPWQTLLKVELPQAFTTIMAGVNQVIMLALSMVVIAALIGAPGLGRTVLSGLSRLDPGTGFVGGIGIVILAIILDRITRSIGPGTPGAGSKGGTA